MPGDADEFYVGVGVGDVGLDLLERAAREKRRGPADEGQQAAIRQPGADADHVLLGDADIDKPLRPPRFEGDELRGTNGVVADRDDLLIALGQTLERRD